MDLETCLRRGEQDHSARVAEHDGRADVAGVEHIFDGENRRLVAANQLHHAVVDLGEPPR